MSQSSLAWRLLVISFFWGASFPLMRHIAADMPALALGGTRGAIAACAVFLFLWITRQLAGINRRMIRHILVVGTCNGWLPNLMTATALQSIEAAPAALIQAAAPLIVAVLSILLLKDEKPGLRAGIGLGIGFLGIALIVGPAAFAGGASLTGALLMLATAASYSCGTIYVRLMRPEASAAQLALGQQFVAALVALPLSLAFDPIGAFDQPAGIWFGLVLLGVFASALPLSLFLGLVQRVPATRASVVGYLQPVWAAIIAALWLSELPEARVVAGGLVALGGVWLATRK